MINHTLESEDVNHYTTNVHYYNMYFLYCTYYDTHPYNIIFMTFLRKKKDCLMKYFLFIEHNVNLYNEYTVTK